MPITMPMRVVAVSCKGSQTLRCSGVGCDTVRLVSFME